MYLLQQQVPIKFVKENNKETKLLLLCRILSHFFMVNTGTADGQVYGHTQKNNC